MFGVKKNKEWFRFFKDFVFHILRMRTNTCKLLGKNFSNQLIKNFLSVVHVERLLENSCSKLAKVDSNY